MEKLVLDMERSLHRKRANQLRREAIAAGKAPKMGSALVMAHGRDTRVDSKDRITRNLPHWVPCSTGTSIRRLMRAGRQMIEYAK